MFLQKLLNWRMLDELLNIKKISENLRRLNCSFSRSKSGSDVPEDAIQIERSQNAQTTLTVT